MRLVAAALEICFQPACIVTFVQAESEFLPRTTRLKGIERIRNQFDVVRVRCCDNQRQRKPVGVRQKAALYALFPSVSGVAACFFVPDSGDLVIQSSIDSQDQSMLSRCPQASKPFCQKRSKTRKRTARAVLTGSCYSVGSVMRQGSSSLTRLTGQSAMTSSTWRR